MTPQESLALTGLVRVLRRRARASNHRFALILSGDAQWTADAASRVVAALADAVPTWLTDRPLAAGRRPIASATRLLGSELQLLIYDAHGGFDPDGFGAASGALAGGGLLVLLTPPLASWHTLADPQAGRIAVWPHTAAGVSGRYLQRMARVLASTPYVVTPGAIPSIGPESGPSWNRPGHPGRELNPAHPATPDQARAIASIVRLAHGRARRPLVIKAHRGRGKSAALGLAAAELLGTGPSRILVTAPRRAAVDALFRHAAAALTDARPDGSGLAYKGRRIGFVPPDEAASGLPEADLMLVDEAAGIPAPLLTRLLAHYPRIVFATTVHGYEGTGRGFEVRFRSTLDRVTPQWRALTLQAPIRWDPDDPLEALTFQALLLDAAPAADSATTDPAPEGCSLVRLDPDALVDDEQTLRELFGLLILAHYQTRPLDLRILLDGPNLRVYALRQERAIVGALIAAEEGGIDEPGLEAAIFEGRRRPRGHLLPQTLSAHAGIAAATRLRFLRVVRIAVHPALARRGLGRAMLRGLWRDARCDGFQLLGTSFGASPDLIPFWDRCGFRPAQVGTSRNAASGEHAVVMLRRVDRTGSVLTATAQRRLERRLPVLLAGPLRDLDPAVGAALVRALRAVPPARETGADPDGADQELAAFAEGQRTFESALPLLSELTRRELGPSLRAGRIDADGAALLIAAARQLRPVTELVALSGARGREDLVARLRRLAGVLLR